MPRRTDTVTPQQRSEIMRAVRSRGNQVTELAFLRLLRRHRITGWRRQVRLTGSPDFLFREARVAVFVDGCFWHGCPEHCRMPKGNRSYWMRKITGNRVRDRQVVRRLRMAGWRVLRVWEHELARSMETRLLRRIRRLLASDSA